MNGTTASKFEVIKHLEEFAEETYQKLIKCAEDSWQPADLLPDSASDSFYEDLKEIKERAAGLDYDLMAVIVGDTITEEALPTYESWLYQIDGMKELDYFSSWNKWIRGWTAEENRHGDLLNKYLYLSGRVNMREMEVSTHYLISDGFDIRTAHDPYKSFVYTSFQEIATNISHRRTGTMAKEKGDGVLAKICGVIAADELRHAKAYGSFISKIFELDPSNMMNAFAEMMKNKIVMPAHFLRETGTKIGSTFSHFSDAAQRLGVYTAADYIEILKSLIKEWNIEKLSGLTEQAERARDYTAALPARMEKVVDRLKIPQIEYKFSWII